jgi:hypothetical protein
MAKSLKAQFADWVAQQPRDAEYDYGDICGCAFHQFLTANGFAVSSVGGSYWRDQSGTTHSLPEGVNYLLLDYPRNFGGLADRLAA